MNHKRKRPKSARSGCLLCKPWKVAGNSNQALKFQDLKLIERFKEDSRLIFSQNPETKQWNWGLLNSAG
ncbi:hypothetical protein A2897_01405 [Candidatus Woesebacteria bacterium RIFCSPLOWO2_01_FULL_44_24b]|nr:MAG: hypothetical protein A2897_01405 [Candidatus Woesebacteria bacterium RIFCSPLOWO2_01_FULL_44_24b]